MYTERPYEHSIAANINHGAGGVDLPSETDSADGSRASFLCDLCLLPLVFAMPDN